MAFDWDEIQVTKHPKRKELGVNFKAVDGQAYPGSPDSELCVRIYSNETFVHITGSAHWVWLELSGVPDRYVKVRLDFDSGNGIEPPSSPQYAEFYPGDERTLQFALSAGEVDDLLNSSNYRATASIADSSCAVSQATVEFVKDVIPPDPEPDPIPDEDTGDGDTIPTDPKPECEAHDCDAVDSLLSTNPEYAEGLWFLTNAEYGTKAATGGTINGIISLNKNLYDNTPVPLTTFAGTATVIGQSLGTGPCYTDRVFIDAPFGGAQARWTSTPSVNFWSAGASFVSGFSMNYSSVLYCPPNTVMTFFPMEFSCGSVWQPSNTGGPTVRQDATANIDRTNNTMTINYPGLAVRTRDLTDIEAATGVVDFEQFYVHQWYQEGISPDEFGNPRYVLVQLIDIEVRSGGVSMIPRKNFKGIQIGLDLGDLEMASSGGLYPNILQGANVLWVGDLVTNETEENKYKRLTEIRTAIQRSWQDYIPPTYCERIT